MVKVTMTDEDLATRTGGNYFSEGVHEVLIRKAERGTTAAGKDFAEITVLGHDDEEGTARLWFSTEAGAKYALSILSGIAVHNREGDAAKEKARATFKAITDTDEVDDKFLARFVEMDAWFLVQKSGGTYQNAEGETKDSYDRNIYGYEPKMKPMTAEQLISSGTPVSTDDVPFK